MKVNEQSMALSASASGYLQSFSMDLMASIREKILVFSFLGPVTCMAEIQADSLS